MSAGAWEPEKWIPTPARGNQKENYLLIELLMPMTGIPAIGVFSIDFTRYRVLSKNLICP